MWSHLECDQDISTCQLNGGSMCSKFLYAYLLWPAASCLHPNPPTYLCDFSHKDWAVCRPSLTKLSFTYPVYTHSSGLPPSLTVCLHPPLYFQLGWIFRIQHHIPWYDPLFTHCCEFSMPGKLGPLVAGGCTVTFTVIEPLANACDRRWRISVRKSLRLSVETRRACFRV